MRRKTFLTLALVLVSLSAAFAQRQGDQALGVHLNFATETSTGLGVRYEYTFIDNIRVLPEFNYYFKHDHASFWDVGANFQYLITFENAYVYPLVGIGYGSAKPEGGSSSGSFQGKVGAGVEVKITPEWKLYAEPKFQFVEHNNQFMFSVGAAYIFDL